MDQVFLDNFLKQLEGVTQELRNISSAMGLNAKPDNASSSIISSADQRKNENNSKSQGDLISLDKKSVEELVKKFQDVFKGDKEKDRKEQKDASTKMLDKLEILTKSTEESIKTQRQQADQKDIEKLTQRDEVKKVFIAGIDATTAKSLIGNFELPGKDSKESGSLLSSLLPLLAPLLGGLGLTGVGSFLAFGGDVGSGAAQIGQLAIKLGEKMLSKTLGGLKKIIGKVFNSGFDALKSMKDSVFKLSDEMLNALPESLKTGFVKIKDKIYKTLSNVFDVGNEIIGKIPGANTIKKFLLSLGGVFGDILKHGLKLFKFIPGLGDVINIYSAYEKFMGGDTAGALVELAGAIPGIGILADFYNIYRDFTYTEKEKAAQNESIANFFGDLGNKFSSVWNNIKKLPFFRGVSNIIDGVKLVMGGSFLDGLKLIGRGVFEMSPVGVIFNAAASVYEWASSLIDSGERESAAPIPAETFEVEKFDLVGIIKNALVAKIKAMTSFVKKLVSKPVEWAKSLWSSVESYFSTSEETAAEKSADAEKAPNLKADNKTNMVAAAAQLSNDAVKGLFNDLKKTQSDKADAQIKAITTTNEILMRIEQTINAFNITTPMLQQQAGKTVAPLVSLQSTIPNMIANKLSQG